MAYEVQCHLTLPRNFVLNSFFYRSILRNTPPKVSESLTRVLTQAREIREVIAKYDPNYMAASLDEAYLNMTSYIREHNLDPTEAVSQLRAEISEKTKITTSAGLGASILPTHSLTHVRHATRQNWIQQEQSTPIYCHSLTSSQTINSFFPTIVKP